MKTTTVLCAIALSALAGCASTHTSQPSSPLKASLVTALRPDITVSNRITGTATITQLFGFINIGSDKFADGVDYGVGGRVNLSDAFAAAKAAAAYEATTKSKADLIVAPRYQIHTVNYFLYKKTTATVEGLKGTLNGARQQ
jgi:hypothetical protein